MAVGALRCAAKVDRSEDMPRLVEHFVPPLVDYVLADYQSNHPDTRDPEAPAPPDRQSLAPAMGLLHVPRAVGERPQRSVLLGCVFSWIPCESRTSWVVLREAARGVSRRVPRSCAVPGRPGRRVPRLLLTLLLGGGSARAGALAVRGRGGQGRRPHHGAGGTRCAASWVRGYGWRGVRWSGMGWLVSS